jgi:hypothetical protein
MRSAVALGLFGTTLVVQTAVGQTGGMTVNQLLQDQYQVVSGSLTQGQAIVFFQKGTSLYVCSATRNNNTVFTTEVCFPIK